MYGVELFDGETARFEVEISEDDVHGQWKLNGEVLSPSSVSFYRNYLAFSVIYACDSAALQCATCCKASCPDNYI